MSKTKMKFDVENREVVSFIPSRIVQSALAFAFLFIKVYVIPPNIIFIYLFYLASSIPFFFAGMSLASAYIAMPNEISKLYFIDLGGAAAATLVLDPLMQKLGAGSTLLLLSVIVSAVSIAVFILLFKSKQRRKESPKIIVTLGHKMKF